MQMFVLNHVPQLAVISESIVTQSLELDLFCLFNCDPYSTKGLWVLPKLKVFSLFSPHTALLEASWVQTAFLSIVNVINFSAAAVCGLLTFI